MNTVRKYTPLLKRFFVFVLCICLFLGVFFKPQEVSAATFVPGQMSVWTMFATSDFAVDTYEEIAEAIYKVWDYLTEDAQDAFVKAEQVAEATGYFEATPKLKYYFITALLLAWPSIKMLVNHAKVKSEEDINEEILVDDGAAVMLPSQEMILDPSLATKDALTYDALTKTNKLLQSSINLFENIKTALHTLHTKLDTFYTEFASYRKGVGNLLNAINSNTYTELRNIHLLINNNVIGWLDTINKNLRDDIYDLKVDLIATVNRIPGKLDVVQHEIVGAVSSVQLGINQLLSVYTGQVVTGVEGLQQGVQTLVDTYTEVYKDQLVVTKPQVEVQVGAQTLVVSDYSTLGTAFSMKMGWIPQIFDFLRELRSRLDPGSAPKLVVDFSSAGGSIDWGDSSYVLDLSWYEPFKPYFDTFISGCLWLCFGWAIYKRIPDIISGVGLTVENATQPQGHVWSDRAERSASLQYFSDRRQDYYKRRGG